MASTNTKSAARERQVASFFERQREAVRHKLADARTRVKNANKKHDAAHKQWQRTGSINDYSHERYVAPLEKKIEVEEKSVRQAENELNAMYKIEESYKKFTTFLKDIQDQPGRTLSKEALQKAKETTKEIQEALKSVKSDMMHIVFGDIHTAVDKIVEARLTEIQLIVRDMRDHIKQPENFDAAKSLETLNKLKVEVEDLGVKSGDTLKVDLNRLSSACEALLGAKASSKKEAPDATVNVKASK